MHRYIYIYVCSVNLTVFDVRSFVERHAHLGLPALRQVHLWTLRSRGGSLVDPSASAGSICGPSAVTPRVAARGPSTPRGPRMDQLLQGRSTGGSATTKGRSAGGRALPVGCPMGGSSTPEVVFWWTSHSRGGSLVDTPLQRWYTGGPSTLRDDIWVWQPSLWFYVCAHAYDISKYVLYIHISVSTVIRLY